MRRDRKPRAQPVFLVDRSVGKKFLITALRDAGLQAEALDDHFSQNAPDEQWLREAGKRGWIVITKDQAIWRNAQERKMLLSERVRMFILTRQDLRGEEMVRIVIAALPAMRTVITKQRAPFAYTISRSGTLKRLA